MLIIFLYHCELFPFGHLAVTFFFILSGFVSYYSDSTIENISLHSNIEYFKEKIMKFYPTYLLTIILGLIVSYSIFNKYSLSKKILIILSNITLTQAFIPNSDYYFSLNGVGWYLSSLAFCYLMFNTYKYYLNKIKVNISLITITIIIVLWIIQVIISLSIINLPYNITQWIIYINPIIRSINFLMGMILAKIFMNKKQSYKFGSRREIIICILFLFIYICSIFIPRAFIWSTYYSPIIMLIIYVFSFQRGVISRILEKDIFIGLSKISFEFYMIHQLVINTCWRFIIYNKLLIAIVSLITSLFLALVLNKVLILGEYFVKKS